METTRSLLLKESIEFVNSAGITSIPGISSNTFDHFWYQSSAITDWGVKDVIGKNLWFEDVAIWDLQVSDDGNGVGSGHSDFLYSLLWSYFCKRWYNDVLQFTEQCSKR